MGLKIVTADLDIQRGVLIDTLRRLLTPESDGNRFDWLYKNLPFGEAKSWLAVDENTETIVGAASAFPRRFYAENRVCSAWVLGDFCLDTAYRSLGPALKLQRACLSAIKSNDSEFGYDFPSPSMNAVYKRMGMTATGKMLRFAKILRVDRKVRELFASSYAGRVASAVGNSLLKLTSREMISDRSLELSVHREECTGEFSTLADEVADRLGICLVRSAEYLNWRYLGNPLVSCELLTARRHGTLKGYAVWMQKGEDAYVWDLFGEDEPELVESLLGAVIARVTERSVMTLSIWLNERHPWIYNCAEMGFQQRDSIPIVYIPGLAGDSVADFRIKKWFLMQGDRDS